MSVTCEEAEAFLRSNAKILVVAHPQTFAEGISLDLLDPAKTYVLAILEVE